jgi:carbonic anhydrase/acetyltransferase-like protein (isoleucine patch superfamily)
MKPTNRRTGCAFRPHAESVEGRLLLSAAPPRVLIQQGFYPAVRPNTPVLPFGAPSSTATFIDPSANIYNGNSVAIATTSLVGPFAYLNAIRGFIKIGVGSSVLDNTSILGNPNHLPVTNGVSIGNSTLIDFGATVRGPAVVGGFASNAAPTSVGANALMDGAIIAPGAEVGPLARVGPGVTVPSGFRVLPGQNVTTNAEASDPALGKVVPVTAADITSLKKRLSNDVALAGGYANLYEGNSATGPSPATVGTNVFNGDLAPVEGSGQQPGTSFEPGKTGPGFLSPRGPLLPGLFWQFRARVTGGANFHARAGVVAHHLGFRNSFRADIGQPFNIAAPIQTGKAVTITAPSGGNVTIGTNVEVGDNAVLTGGPAPLVIHDNVSIGSGAVVSQSNLGAGVTVGSRAYVVGSTIPAGAVVPPGAIIINGKNMGTVQW